MSNPFSKPFEAICALLLAIVLDITFLYSLPAIITLMEISDGAVKAILYGAVYMIMVIATIVRPYLILTSE